jgi:uncharacterized surface protein with fasciclin (FAS1) repeats
MKTERQILKRGRQLLLAAGLLLTSGAGLVACSDYDLDERTPDGWGSSIYSWLDEQGNYTNTVRLIDDLGFREVLAKTGSRTLFVADDAAYDRFYKNNSWGVKSYGDLSVSQKKLLLFGSMMNNSMQLNSLPSVEGNPPKEGECMRRYSSSSTYDSVAVLTKADMPDNLYWKSYRESGLPMVCMTDNSQVPLVQFIEKQLVNKHITNSDYDFINNCQTTRQAGDASINGVSVDEPNIKCSNGFIHKMAEVITPLPNMAELIRKKPNVSMWNSLLERFCAPFPLDKATTTQYNYLYDKNVDTVFQKRFFSEKSQDGKSVDVAPDKVTPISGLLKFDPEWNDYYTGLNDQEGNIAMQRDMAVMMVPSDSALRDYWNNGAGKVLRDYYAKLENVPNDVINELINVNMLGSFVSSVPSKFSGILNDANDPMGVKVEDIDSVWLACNGAIYQTNKVYTPTAFVSVSYPVIINETMNIIKWAIDKDVLQYKVYLNSLNSRYSFFIPRNQALLQYIDPCSYGKNQRQLLRFHYDSQAIKKSERVWASVWNYDPETGMIGDSIGRITDEYTIKNRLKDVLETHIVIGDVEDGHEYYRTKGGTEIRVKNPKAGANGMTVEGSFQANEGQPLRVTQVYDQTKGGNGKAYILDDEPIMTTRKTVRDILADHEEFSKFLELMDGSGLFEMIHNKRNATAGQNISAFNTYHYTVYVPSNASIQALQDAKQLPTWEQVEAYGEAGNISAKTRDSLKIVNFLKYHIQDNALFIGAEKDSAEFETAVIDPATERFYRVTAQLTDNGITIKDQACKKDKNRTPAKVVTTDPRLYNLMAREYQYDSSDAKKASNIETTSSAVIHLIDKPLSLGD